MSSRNSVFYRRIESLSAGQRALLAHRLGLSDSLAIERESATVAAGKRKRLLAYLECPDPETLSLRDIEAYARSRLPDYMLPESIVLLESLPRTPAGKIDRRALRSIQLVEKTADENGIIPPRTEAERILSVIWSEVLGVEALSIQDNFFEVGGDSLLSIRILARAKQQGLHIAADDFFAHPTIEGQARLAGEPTSVKAEAGLVTGPAPLTPIQHWFFQNITTDPQQWNQSVLLEVGEQVDFHSMERAVQQLLLHHDALRLRFRNSDDGWSQTIDEPGYGLPISLVDLAADSTRSREDLRSRTIESSCRGFDLGQSPLMRLVFFKTPQGERNQLLIVAHHLVLDAHSWHILLQDLETACAQLLNGERMRLPEKTSSFKAWAARLVEQAQSDAIHGQRSHWLGIPGRTAASLPVDFQSEPTVNQVSTSDTVAVSLGSRETHELLYEVPKAYRTQINDLLLTALYQTITAWSGECALLVDLEGHGREALFDDLDVSRTIGWFTTVYPLWLETDAALEPGRLLVAVKEQLRGIPDRGIGHGLLSHLSRDDQLRASLAANPRPQICFNYLGRTHREPGLLSLQQENIGPVRSPAGQRAYLLDINAKISDERLIVEWSFSHRLHRRQTIANLAGSFVHNLNALITHCCSPDAGAYTPSDFPMSGLDQNQLDGLAELLDQIDGQDGRE